MGPRLEMLLQKEKLKNCWGWAGRGEIFKKRHGEIRKLFPQRAVAAGATESSSQHCPPRYSEQEVKVQCCLLSITIHINTHRKIKSCYLALLPLDVLINMLAIYSL